MNSLTVIGIVQMQIDDIYKAFSLKIKKNENEKV